ncbi:MAG: ATP-binding protein [Fimbriimonadaceae bacterium]|nr:ATP-binding protein [Fimbriimonadaceae bacterium]
MIGTSLPIHNAIADALIADEFDRLFGTLLGWDISKDEQFHLGEFTAGLWPGRIEDIPQQYIGWQEWKDGWRLFFWFNNGVTWIPIRKGNVSAYSVQCIARWHRSQLGSGLEESIHTSFCVRTVAKSFREDIAKVFDEHREEFRALAFSTHVFPSTYSPISIGEQHAIGAIGKLMWLAFLVDREDCDFLGDRNYLRAIVHDWESRNRFPSLEARVTTSVSTIMCDGSDASRMLASDQIGDVPRLSPWFAHPADPETVVSFIPTQSILSDQFLLRLVGSDGLLWKYPIMLREPQLHELGVFICPEIASGVLDTLRTNGDEVGVFRLHERCQWEIAAHLGIGPLLQDLEAHHGERMNEFFVIDPDCRTGQYICAMVHELMIVRARIARLRGDEWNPIESLRSILRNQVRGYSREVAFVRLARVRLAQVCMYWVPNTHEIRLSEVSECLRIGSVAGLSPGPLPVDSREGPTIEFKATFEWNKRLGQRDANIRQSVFRTICAFMNSQGGTVYIGVNDNGEPIGADDDLALINDENPEDMFVQKITELLRRNLEPYSPGSVSVTFPKIANRSIIAIEVKERPGITYLKEKVGEGDLETTIYVRDGNRTLRLQGRERDRFVLQRFRSTK